MSGRRTLALALLGIMWAVVCLVVPPLVVNWLVPVPATASVRHAGGVVDVPQPAREDARERFVPDLETPKRIDIYGNEIANPVARYRVDDHGTLYEVHSPETEVPRLGPPRL